MTDEWTALSTRIKSLVEAARMQAAFLSINKADSYATCEILRSQVDANLAAGLDFSSRFDARLSDSARASVARAQPAIARLTSNETTSRDVIQQQAWAGLLLLATYESEMSFFMTDMQDALRLRSERAFAHLQRLIVVDADFRRKWVQAFNAGEPECERHGAVHLLLHGIWAFKVGGAGVHFSTPSRMVNTMASEYRNDSRVIAEGFVAVYVRDPLTAEDRANAVENLAAIMERVYYHGYHRGQLEFTSELIKRIGPRPEIPAAELTALASSLIAAP